MYLHVVLFLAVAACLVEGYEYPNVCPKISPKNVDLSKYAGKWFNVMHTQPESFTCSRNKYSFTTHGSSSLLTIDFHYRLHNGTILDSKSGLFRIPETVTETYDDETNDGQSIGNMYVLDIDYDKYAVEYLCSDNNGEPFEIIIFSTRTGTLDEQLKMKMLNVLTQNHITTVPVDEQAGCAGL